MYLFSMSLTRRMLGALLAAGAALTMAGTASATEVRRYVDSLGKPVERLYISMIRDAEATEELVIEVPGMGALIVQDFVYNNVHAVVSRSLDNWIDALNGLEKRANGRTMVLAGHGEPTGVAAFGETKAYLNAVEPLMLANIGKPEHADVSVNEIAERFPSRRMPQLLRLGLSRALPN